MAKQYQVIGLGGTFDHFHAGHEKFLRFAADLADTLHIGITQPALTIHKPWAQLIELPETRQQSVATFCVTEGIKYELSELTDIYGPTLTHSRIQALAVTAETKASAEKINQTRLEKGLPTLPIHVCDFALDENGQPIHAERIRAGEINRQGRVYANIFSQNIVLTDSQRHFFSQPQGSITTQFPQSTTWVAVVGDHSLESFITAKRPYNLGVFDLKKMREPFYSPVVRADMADVVAINPPGKITLQLIKALQKSLLKPRSHILVEGEEDLAAVALFLLLPLNATVYYGQPHQGVVGVTITETFKEKIAHILSQ